MTTNQNNPNGENEMEREQLNPAYLLYTFAGSYICVTITDNNYSMLAGAILMPLLMWLLEKRKHQKGNK